jgi:hypothetical protein
MQVVLGYGANGVQGGGQPPHKKPKLELGQKATGTPAPDNAEAEAAQGDQSAQDLKAQQEAQDLKAQQELEKKQKKDDMALINNFVALKKTHDTTVQMSKDLKDQIQIEADFSWANTDIMLGPLKRADQDIQELKNSSPIWKAWCVEQKAELL